MVEPEELDARLASALRIPVDVLKGSGGYHDTPGWDSFGHVDVILTLEQIIGTPIDDIQARALRNREAIHAFCGNVLAGAGPADAAGAGARRADGHRSISRGLAGVIFATTSICEIDGDAGKLSYRGIDIETLVGGYRYDDVCSLLIDGTLPYKEARRRFVDEIGERATLSPLARRRAEALVGMDPDRAMAALIPILNAEVPVDISGSRAIREVGLSLLARLPMALATALGIRDAPPPGSLSGVDSLVGYMLRHLGILAEDGDPEALRYIDTIFLLQAEHSSNASAFAARVATGACAAPDMALASAIATFSGSLHGGAIRHVVRQMEEIGTTDRVGRQLRDRRARGEPIYGFGHRVYRVTDPRARIMERMILQMIDRGYDPEPYHIIRETCREMANFASKGIAPNVDLYAGTIYHMLSISSDLLLPLFCFARLPGWLAHIREQDANNVLIRPEMIYVPDGPTGAANGNGRS